MNFAFISSDNRVSMTWYRASRWIEIEILGFTFHFLKISINKQVWLPFIHTYIQYLSTFAFHQFPYDNSTESRWQSIHVPASAQTGDARPVVSSNSIWCAFFFCYSFLHGKCWISFRNFRDIQLHHRVVELCTIFSRFAIHYPSHPNQSCWPFHAAIEYTFFSSSPK